jgi:hypothetical protein
VTRDEELDAIEAAIASGDRYHRIGPDEAAAAFAERELRAYWSWRAAFDRFHRARRRPAIAPEKHV